MHLLFLMLVNSENLMLIISIYSHYEMSNEISIKLPISPLAYFFSTTTESYANTIP